MKFYYKRTAKSERKGAEEVKVGKPTYIDSHNSMFSYPNPKKVSINENLTTP